MTMMSGQTSTAVSGTLMTQLILMCSSAVNIMSEKPHTGQGLELWYTSNLDEYENVPVTFSGRIPEWLRGTLFRNGPAWFEMNVTSQTHVMDGFAKLLKIDFDGSFNSAKFTTKFIQSGILNTSRAAGKISPSIQFGPRKPRFDTYEKLQALFEGADNMNVNLYCLGRNMTDCMAISDLWAFYSVDPVSLKTKNKINPDLIRTHEDKKLEKYLLSRLTRKISQLSSAHPLPVFNATDYISIKWDIAASFLHFHKSFKLHIVRLKSSQQRTVVATVERKMVSYVHSMAVTENHVILFLDPLYLDFTKALISPTVMDTLEWRPEEGTDILIVNLNSGKVRTVHTRFARVHLHHVNAYERLGNIYIDVVTYPDTKMFETLFLRIARNASEWIKVYKPPTVRRYKLHLDSGFLAETRIPKRMTRPDFVNHFDFPSINEHFRHRHYCFVYGVATGSTGQLYLVKRDFCYGKDYYWSTPNHYPSEPLFVPRPGREHEDDGVIVSVVLDGQNGQSYILVLGARRLTVITKAFLGARIPFTVHGHYYATKQTD